VNTSISSVSYLYGYQNDILYNQTIFNITSSNITEGPFLKGGAVQTFCVAPNISAPGAIKNIACTRQGPTNVSGSGNLTTLAFNLNISIAPTTTRISIVNSKLSDINSQPISHAIANGTINIYRCFSGEQRSCGPSAVGECRSGTITCNTSNDWGPCVGAVYPAAELCDGKDNNCNGQYDENTTGTGNLSRSCSLFHYGICAAGNEICNGADYVGCPAPQTEICYNGINEDCDPTGDSTCRGDVIQDGCIDISDLSLVGSKFGLRSSDAGWDPRADIDTNSVVDIFDLVFVGKDFGVGC
jgi:hypothetical protein